MIVAEIIEHVAAGEQRFDRPEGCDGIIYHQPVPVAPGITWMPMGFSAPSRSLNDNPATDHS